jgi:hypothetical protein
MPNSVSNRPYSPPGASPLARSYSTDRRSLALPGNRYPASAWTNQALTSCSGAAAAVPVRISPV